MSDFFADNLTALSAQTPGLKRLPSHLPPGVDVQPAATGAPTARCHGLLLHSVYDPVKEAAGFAAAAAPGTRIFLYGFGLGYHVQALLEKIGPQGRLLVLELNPALLAAALHLRNLTGLAGDPRFDLIFPENETQAAEQIARGMAWLDPDGTGAPVVLFHPPSFQCLPAGFDRIANALEVLRLERRVPALFGNLEAQNFAFNQEAVRACPGLNTLRQRYARRPGLLISAGPSLDGLIPYLPELQKRCITGCVDTALPVLQALGLTPHFVFTLDPQDHSFTHFEDFLDCPAPLVFTPTANARVVRLYRGGKIVVFKEQQAATRGHGALEQEKGTTRAGGSVSCLGLDCLIQMGCDPILLVGQDCAFSGNRSYARRAFAEDRLGGTVSPHQAPDAAQRRQARRHKPVKVDGCNGDPVITSQILFSYLRTLEQIARAHPQTRVVNLGSHGARIDHAETLGSVNELMTILG